MAGLTAGSAGAVASPGAAGGAVGGIASCSPCLLFLVSCFGDEGSQAGSGGRCYITRSWHLSGQARRCGTSEQPWAQLACEGKGSSPCPQVRTRGAPLGLGSCRSPAGTGTGMPEAPARAGWVGWLLSE